MVKAALIYVCINDKVMAFFQLSEMSYLIPDKRKLSFLQEGD